MAEMIRGRPLLQKWITQTEDKLKMKYSRTEHVPIGDKAVDEVAMEDDEGDHVPPNNVCSEVASRWKTVRGGILFTNGFLFILFQVFVIFAFCRREFGQTSLRFGRSDHSRVDSRSVLISGIRCYHFILGMESRRWSQVVSSSPLQRISRASF